MSETLTLEQLRAAIEGRAAAFRCRRKLQPAGGEGDKVFPPTYARDVYHVEQRRLPGYEQPVTCVVLDSVQSQANRIEEALQQAVDAERLKLPLITVDFDGAELIEPVGRITSLQTPHRAADAILRDSQTEDGKAFRESEVGGQISQASMRKATPLYQYCPTALIFGMWDSTGPKGGLGEKFERAMVSEVVGIDAEIGRKSGSRVDPLGIRANAGPLYETRQSARPDWTLDESEAAKESKKPKLFNRGGTAGKPGNPSKANHGNITPTLSEVGGVTVEYAEQVTTLSLMVLRRLRFPDSDGRANAEAEVAARTLLAALGMCGATLAFGNGMALRSRCLLWPGGPMRWELLERPGEEPTTFGLDEDSAIRLLEQAAKAAEGAGLPWHAKQVPLKPTRQLVELVRRSQELAVAEGAEE